VPNDTIEWYNTAHEGFMLQADPEFYKSVADLVEGLYLDISCGLGITLKFHKGVGCDFSRKSITFGRKFAQKSLFVICDAQYLPFRSEVFNTVSCLGSLEHYPNHELALSEAFRVLRKKGKLLLSVTNRCRWTSIFRLFSRGFRQPVEKPLNISETMKLLIDTGFNISKVFNPSQFDFRTYCSLPHFFGHFLNKIDKIMPTSSAIEPFYISKKI